MDSVQSGPQQSKKYEPTKVSDIRGIVKALTKHPAFGGYEVYVELPDGTYCEVNAVSTSDDTFVLKLDNKVVDPYEHDE